MQPIKDYLTLTGMSQAELARKAGMDTVYLNRLLAGKHEPRVKILRKLSEVTGISLQKLAESL